MKYRFRLIANILVSAPNIIKASQVLKKYVRVIGSRLGGSRTAHERDGWKYSIQVESTEIAKHVERLSSNNDPKLLPCPFCGNDLNQQDPLDTIYPVNREGTIWNVFCTESSGGCDASIMADTAEQAIKKWNSRTV